MPRIVLEHLSKDYDGILAVDDLDMVIEDREFVTLLGPSGCGKTTTLRMIAGLETPSGGRITIGDRVVYDAEKGINVSPAKRDIGFLFQNYALWPHMTVYENISFSLENLKWSKERIQERVEEMLKLLRIEPLAKRYPGEISGGQQQRVAIARTLAPEPKLILMDEPLSNLDAKLRLEMRTELKRLHADTDSTFVYVTHDQLEAMALATGVCPMENGRMQQYAPPLETYSDPANLFVADFVGNPAINFYETTGRITGEKTAEVDLFGHPFVFKAGDALGKYGGEGFVLGIRPEFVSLAQGALKGKVYATLPAGMETTVKLEVREYLLTSVKFGSVDYRIRDDMDFEISGDGIILFDKSSGKNIGKGSLSF